MLKEVPLGSVIFLLLLPPLPDLLLGLLLLLAAALDRSLRRRGRSFLHRGRGRRRLFGRLLGRGLFLRLKKTTKLTFKAGCQ